MKYTLLLFLLATQSLFGQAQKPILSDSPTFEKAVSRSVRFPSNAQRMGKSVRVYVSFTLDKEGKYQNVAVANFGPIDESLKQEVSRVWSVLPSQDPKYSGNYIIPITFMLGENGPKQLKPISNRDDKIIERGEYIVLAEVSVIGYTLCELHELSPILKP